MPPAPRALKTFSKAKGLSPMAQSFQPRSVSAGKSTLKPASPKATSNSTPSAFAAFLTPSATPSPSIQPQAQPNQSASSFSFKPLPPSSSTPVSSSSASQGLSTLSQATLSTPQKRKASYNAPPLEIPVASTSKLSTPPSTGKHIRLATQQRQPASPPPLTPKTAKPKVTYQDPAKLIQELAQRLAEEMLESMVHIDLQLLVADVLTHQEFKEDTRIQSALDRRCGTAATHLLEPLIEDCMAEIVLSVQSDRNILKRAFKRWIRARQKRQSHFREMSRADSRSWVEVASTSLSIVDSLPLGKSSITEDIDMDASMALDFAQSKREAFWRAQSFARLLEAHVDQLFAHAHPSKKPQWDTIISVGESLQSVAGMWYRHKLGIDPQGIATGLQCRRTETDVRLADSDSFLSMVSLHSADPSMLLTFFQAADHLGLVVFDLASEETKSQRQKRFQSLSDRCLALSSYNPALLFVAWPMKNETSAACLSRVRSSCIR